MSGKIVYLAQGVTASGIQAAIDKLADNDTLVLPKNQTISTSTGFKVNVSSKSVTIDLNGSTLQQAGDNAVISVDGRMAEGASAKISHNVSGAVTVSYSGASGVAVGNYVKVYADNTIPNDQGALTRVGQAMKVTAVNGSTLTLEGTLLYEDHYKTNVRASEYESGTAIIKNGTVRGDQSHTTWNSALVSVRSTIDTQIENVTVRDGNSMGMNFVNTVNGLVTQSAAINLTDDTANGHYGYGVHSASSVGTVVNGFYAERVRHAVDDNAVGLSTTHVDPSKYGADIGLMATNVVANATTAFAFSWHSEGRFSTYSDSLVFNSFGVMGGRGTDNSFRDISGSGNGKGLVFYEYGEGDGRRITADNINLQENSGYAYFNQNNPAENILSNSTFEILTNKVTIDPSSPTIKFINNTLKIGAFATNETITGTDGADRLLGGLGIDTIRGGSGNDYIWGGAGADLLAGGSGQNRFAFLKASEAGDSILDFKAGSSGDVLDLSVFARQFKWTGDLLGGGYVRFVDDGADAIVQVDLNGGADNYVTLATLKNIDASSLTSANVSTKIMVTDYDPIGSHSWSGGLPGSGAGEGGPIVSEPDAPAAIPDAFSDLGTMAYQNGADGNDTLLGTSARDLLVAGDGSDWLGGGSGDDVLAGGAGADILMGGSGRDTASYADASAGVTVSLRSSGSNTGDAAGDTYSQIENLTGSAYADKIIGGDTVNTLRGGAGNDQIFGYGGTDTLFGGSGADILDGGTQNDILNGGEGNDILIGALGYDRMTGGAGADRFTLNAPKYGTDTIVDFAHGTDKIALPSEFHIDSFDDINFISGSTPKATNNEPTLLYNAGSGTLWWDADGKYGADPVHIATLEGAPSLSLSDFILL